MKPVGEGDEEVLLQARHACSVPDKFLFYRQLRSNYLAIFVSRMEGNVRLYTEGLQRINFTFLTKMIERMAERRKYRRVGA